MKTASITEAKNQLSALIDFVRRGEAVVITDRGRPVARLTSAIADSASDPEGRLARLERQGTVRRAEEPSPVSVIRRPPPAARAGGDILKALLEERAEGR